MGKGIDFIRGIFILSFIITAINFTVFKLWKREYKLYFKSSMNLGILITLAVMFDFFIKNYK